MSARKSRRIKVKASAKSAKAKTKATKMAASAARKSPPRPKKAPIKAVKTRAASGSARGNLVSLSVPFSPLVSQLAQVSLAVSHCLQRDGHWPPINRAAVMGATYYYNLDTMRDFLYYVRQLLAEGNPSYGFEFDDAFCNKAVNQSVEQLIGAVNDVVTMP